MPDRASIARRRVVAHLIDWADEPVAVVWTALWLRGPLAVAWLGWVGLQLLRQARSGQTAGKHCVGLAVLDRSSRAPIGVPRTALRWIAHGVDTCVPIAWARCLLGHDTRTFADAVAGTDVVDVPTG